MSYLAIAKVAPHLPRTLIGSAYTHRFTIPYVLGTISHVTGLPLTAAFRLAWVVVGGGDHRRLGPRARGIACVDRCVLPGHADRRRQPLRFPLLRDSARHGGRSGVRPRPCPRDLRARAGPLWIVLAGVALGTIARQTMLPVSLVVTVLVYLAPQRAGTPRLRRAVSGLTPILVAASLTVLIDAVTSPFSANFEPRIPGDTILAVLPHLGADLGMLADHTLRVVSPLLVPLGLLGAAFVLFMRLRPRPSVPFWF